MSFTSDNALQINQLPLSIDFPRDPERLLETMTLSYKQTVDAMNSKEGALYLLQEQGTFIQYFPVVVDPNSSLSLSLRPIYRMVFDLVALNGGPIPPGTTTIAVPANQLINQIVDPTRVRGGATISGPMYVSLHSAKADAVFDNTVPGAQTIIVTNNYSSEYSQAYFVIEYTKT
jgi:hypothetical protein